MARVSEQRAVGLRDALPFDEGMATNATRDSVCSMDKAAEFLIDKARGRAMGSGDNLSLVVVKLEPLDT